MALQVGQSVVLGYLTEYFSIQDPSSQDTRDAYFLATGGSCDCHVTYLIVILILFVVCLLHTCICILAPPSPLPSPSPPFPPPYSSPSPSPLSLQLSPPPLPSPPPLSLSITGRPCDDGTDDNDNIFPHLLAGQDDREYGTDHLHWCHLSEGRCVGCDVCVCAWGRGTGFVV